MFCSKDGGREFAAVFRSKGRGLPNVGVPRCDRADVDPRITDHLGGCRGRWRAPQPRWRRNLEPGSRAGSTIPISIDMAVRRRAMANRVTRRRRREIFASTDKGELAGARIREHFTRLIAAVSALRPTIPTRCLSPQVMARRAPPGRFSARRRRQGLGRYRALPICRTRRSGVCDAYRGPGPDPRLQSLLAELHSSDNAGYSWRKLTRNYRDPQPRLDPTEPGLRTYHIYLLSAAEGVR